MGTFLQNLRTQASNGPLRKIIFPEAQDERVLEAAKVLAEEKIAIPLLVCSPENVHTAQSFGLDYIEIEEERSNVLKQLLLELRSSKIGTKDELTTDEAHRLAHDPLMYGMYSLRIGEGDGIVAGAVRTTADVVRTALWLIGKAKDIKTISSSFYMVIPGFRDSSEEEVLTFADCAVVPEPSSEQLADIAIASADARMRIVGDEPRIALLSYSTHGSGGNSTSIHTVQNALELVRKRRPELVIDGELQADAALVQSIAKQKSPESVIGGRANVLIFPSLDAANIAYKLVAHLSSGVHAVGPILQGMKKPVSDVSRGAQADDIIHIASITAAQVDTN